jgi:hypothetical protein
VDSNASPSQAAFDFLEKLPGTGEVDLVCSDQLGFFRQTGVVRSKLVIDLVEVFYRVAPREPTHI